MLRIKNITCEYERRRLGTDVKKPRFSWQIQSDQKATKQVTYQIQVSLDSDFKQLVWDTGVIKSDQSLHLVYEGMPLKSCTRYYYQVQVSDNCGQLSQWSAPDWFETAFLDRAFTTGKWIAPRSQMHNEAVYSLQKVVTLSKDVQSARAYITALGLYELRINGVKAGNQVLTPGWTSYHHRLQYQTYDVTKLLVKGENLITIILAEGWYKGMGFQVPYEYGSDLAALLELHFIDRDGVREIIKTDETWKEVQGPFIKASIYHGETYDARFHDELIYNTETSRHIKCLKMLDTMIVVQVNEPVRVTETIKPIELLHTPKGETVLDMGQNMVGRLKITVTASRGTRICLS